MKYLSCLLTLAILSGCQADPPLVLDQALPSSGRIQVLSFQLVWGDAHSGGENALALDYVSAFPQSDEAAREREAIAAFELIRGASETWGFRQAGLTARASADRKGGFDVFAFDRGADGRWVTTHAISSTRP